MLTNPRDLAAGPKGYVMCNVAVLAKGEKTRLPPDTDGDDDIEGPRRAARAAAAIPATTSASSFARCSLRSATEPDWSTSAARRANSPRTCSTSRISPTPANG
ncbi:unnamed protein product, partial [Trichogramma brassicae]